MKQYIKSIYQHLLESKKEEYRIYSDMDGVIVDFDKKFKSIHQNPDGKNIEDFMEEKGVASTWFIINKQGEEFWSSMEWMSDGKDYWDYIKKYDPTILSSPSRQESAMSGKYKWVKKHLGIEVDKYYTEKEDFLKDKDDVRIILSEDKHEFVDPNKKSILIDDTKEKIESWEEAGGIGILHRSAEETIDKLKSMGL